MEKRKKLGKSQKSKNTNLKQAKIQEIDSEYNNRRICERKSQNHENMCGKLI